MKVFMGGFTAIMLLALAAFFLGYEFFSPAWSMLAAFACAVASVAWILMTLDIWREQGYTLRYVIRELVRRSLILIAGAAVAGIGGYVLVEFYSADDPLVNVVVGPVGAIMVIVGGLIGSQIFAPRKVPISRF